MVIYSIIISVMSLYFLYGWAKANYDLSYKKARIVELEKSLETSHFSMTLKEAELVKVVMGLKELK